MLALPEDDVPRLLLDIGRLIFPHLYLAMQSIRASRLGRVYYKEPLLLAGWQDVDLV